MRARRPPPHPRADGDAGHTEQPSLDHEVAKARLRVHWGRLAEDLDGDVAELERGDDGRGRVALDVRGEAEAGEDRAQGPANSSRSAVHTMSRSLPRACRPSG